jgi:hypothetical protein
MLNLAIAGNNKRLSRGACDQCPVNKVDWYERVVVLVIVDAKRSCVEKVALERSRFAGKSQ